MGIRARQATCVAICCLAIGAVAIVLRMLGEFQSAGGDNSLHPRPAELRLDNDSCCDFEGPDKSSQLKSAIQRWLASDAPATAQAAQLHSEEMLLMVYQLWGEVDPESAIVWIHTHSVDSFEAGKAFWAVSEGFVRKDGLAAIESKFTVTWGKHLKVNDELLQGLHRHHRPEEIEALMVRIPESRELLQPVLFSYARDLLEAEGSEAALGFMEARKDRDLRVAGASWFIHRYLIDDRYQAVLDWYSRQTDPKMNYSKERIAERIAVGLLSKEIDFSELSASVGESIMSESLQKWWDANVAFEAGDSLALGRQLSGLRGYSEDKLLVSRARETLEDASMGSRLDFALSMCNSSRIRGLDNLGNWNYLDAVVTASLMDNQKSALAWAEGGHAENLPDSPARLVAKHWIEFDPLSEDPGNWAIASLEGEPQNEAVSAIVTAMMQADPAETIAWVEGIGDLDARAFALGEAASNWWLNDADAANAWIGMITLDSDRDIALAGSVKIARYGHPETDVALGTISRIENGTIRRNALFRLFNRNSFDARAPEAQERLASNSILPEDRVWLARKYGKMDRVAVKFYRKLAQEQAQSAEIEQ